MPAFFSNVLTDVNLTDMETCRTMIPQDLLLPLPLIRDRFGVEPGFTARPARGSWD